MPGRRAALLAGLAAIAMVAYWRGWWPGTASAIRRELSELSDAVNEPAGGALGGAARAAAIGSYFTDDVVIDLGQGTAPIEGRETLIAMLSRLEPRTSQFTLRFEDVTLQSAGDATADVNLTAEIVRAGAGPRDSGMDAREFALTFRKVDGEWRIARVRAVETIR